MTDEDKLKIANHIVSFDIPSAGDKDVHSKSRRYGLISESIPWHKDDVFSLIDKEAKTQDPWSRKSPEQIAAEMKSLIDHIRSEIPERTKIIIVSHSERQGSLFLKNIIKDLISNPSIDVSFREHGDLLENKDDLLCFKLPNIKPVEFKPLYQGCFGEPKKLEDLFPGKEPETKKPRTFNDRPSIPNKKRRWKK